ncbi:hypothetical protein CGI76_22740 [Vibrio parahaemolyticus]|nr:hypothetical protein CGI76_22740 [Vibrio parahaemolyticus]
MSIRFSKLAIQDCRFKFLNISGRKNMPRFAGCLIGFHSRLVVSFTGSKCGKGKLIEAFVLALSL